MSFQAALAAASGVAFTVDFPIFAFGGFGVSASAGTPSPPQPVAVFVDLGGAENLKTDYSATINWGDSSLSSGTITLTNGLFIVQGSHNYARGGTYSLTVTINHDSTVPVAVNSTANVAGGAPPGLINPFFEIAPPAATQSSSVVLAAHPATPALPTQGLLADQSNASINTDGSSAPRLENLLPARFPSSSTLGASLFRDARDSALLTVMNEWDSEESSFHNLFGGSTLF